MSFTQTNEITPDIAIKRMHGLGNVICLLPVLDRLYNDNTNITVITRQEWIPVFKTIRPEYNWTAQIAPNAIDLDTLTANIRPIEHRTDELGRILGVGRPFQNISWYVPTDWSKEYESLRGSIIFAPEGGHPARQWPREQAGKLSLYLKDKPLVLIGLEKEPPLPCDYDLRGTLELHELFGLIAVAGTVITMDSGILHVATLLGIPTVAIFGGINPAYRIRPEQPVIAIQSAMDCCPCNKDETCGGHYPCIASIEAGCVANAVQLAKGIKRRAIYQVVPSTDEISKQTPPPNSASSTPSDAPDTSCHLEYASF